MTIKQRMKKIFLSSLVFFFLLLGVCFLVPLEIPVNQQWSFYDHNGELLYSEKPYMGVEETNENDLFFQYLIAIEDQDFYAHVGVDFGSLGRAFVQNLYSGEVVSGASTLTMQLARILFLPEANHDWWYKIRQIWYALKLEQQMTKDEILNLYADQVYLGQGAVGFDAAAYRYFSKSLRRLDLSEMAMLIGIIPRPDAWNPISDLDQAENRKNMVLAQLRDRDFISDEDADRFSASSLVLDVSNKNSVHSPHFVFWAHNQLRPRISDDLREVRVYTTLDKAKYERALDIVRKNIERNQQTKHMSNASVVGLSVPDNRLEVLLGSSDFFDTSRSGQVNMATATRELGSTLKPFLFALALEEGFSPLDVVHDERQSFVTDEGSYSPRNFDPHTEYGMVRFRESLSNSYNISAVDLLNRLGVGRFVDFLSRFGFSLDSSARDIGLSVVLGTGESSLLDLVRAYSVFSHQGQLLPVQFFDRVVDGHGETVLRWDDFVSNRPSSVLDIDSAEWVIHALSDQSARWKNFSRGNPLELEFETASKTGTSQDFRDNYVVGFSSDYVVGTWVGNTDGTPMITSSGVEGAGPIWQSVMRMIHDEVPDDFEYHGNRKQTPVCRWAWESYPECAEQYQAFVLDSDIEKLKSSSLSHQEPKLRIAFPGDGDVLHRDSSLLIQVRNAPSDKVQYFVDGNPTSNIIESLNPGPHTVRVEYQNEWDEIEIFVEP
jgi:membrane carboxypeptidase/penicillin-binding protein PbpC